MNKHPRVVAQLLPCLVLLLSTLIAPRAEAITGGSTASDLAPSVARLTDTKGKQLCTGSVVGDGWILTAYHCYTAVNSNAANIAVQIWRNGTVGSGDSYKSSVSSAKYMAGAMAPAANPPGNLDVVLLKTATGMPDWVKTIPMALSWPTNGTTLTQYGYGVSSVSYNKQGIVSKTATATTLQKTPSGDLKRVDCAGVSINGFDPAKWTGWKTGHICTQGATSAAWWGDSGGPLLWWVNGYWQQVGDFSAFTQSTPHSNIYWSESDGGTRDWITQQVRSPVSAGTILRVASTGTSWLYGADGYRHWIPDATTYNCLTSQGAQVSNRVLREIETIPDMVGSGGWATCSLPPPPPPPGTVLQVNIQDDYLGGTWARNDPNDGTWYSNGVRPPNGAYWYPNGLGVAVNCARSAASYTVRFFDGHTEVWNTWFHVTDGKWYPSATTTQVFNNSFYGLSAC